MINDFNGSCSYVGEFNPALAGDPDWNCPNCGWTNFAIRVRCRNCNRHVDELFPGEGQLVGCFVIVEREINE
jgi:predicted RNA-binding Zn-ribbon protein involved in translation (DUF1610 family)